MTKKERVEVVQSVLRMLEIAEEEHNGISDKRDILHLVNYLISTNCNPTVLREKILNFIETGEIR